MGRAWILFLGESLIIPEEVPNPCPFSQIELLNTSDLSSVKVNKFDGN